MNEKKILITINNNYELMLQDILEYYDCNKTSAIRIAILLLAEKIRKEKNAIN